MEGNAFALARWFQPERYANRPEDDFLREEILGELYEADAVGRAPDGTVLVRTPNGACMIDAREQNYVGIVEFDYVSNARWPGAQPSPRLRRAKLAGGMRVAVRYSTTVDDWYRRAIRRFYGEEGLATRAEVQDWLRMYGTSMDDDLNHQEQMVERGERPEMWPERKVGDVLAENIDAALRFRAERPEKSS